MEELLDKLNDKQREAVEYLDGPLLVLAGAGSGKTRVLTYKIAYLIMSGVIKPYQVLAITFTNKAAREMKERTIDLLGPEANDVWLGTFHSICIRILKREIESIGFSRNFSIFDEDDKNKLLKKIVKDLGFDEKAYKNVGNEISGAKNELINPAKYEALYRTDYYRSKIAKIYEQYQIELQRNDALDFDDIINNTVKIFERNPEILEHYQNKFKYVLVDEYQDTNKTQYKLISMIASKGNICVVGDESQSIYGWRGADISNILNFEKTFENAKIIKLEENYRSTQNILKAANELIKNNESKIDKNLWTKNVEGEKITIYSATNEYDEARYVVRNIIDEIRKDNIKLSDVAILYRTNVQSRVLEEVLIQEGVAYRLIGGLKFYSRKEIKDVMAYLKLINNPKDNVSFKRIINEPKRGIGDTTVEKIEKLADAKDVSMFELLKNEEVLDIFRAKAALKDFRDKILELIEMKETESVGNLLDAMLSKTKYMAQYMLDKECAKENENRIENIKEFIGVAKEFEKEQSDNKLSDFLDTIALVADVDKLDEDDIDKVTLMTLHNSKGLEYKVVFIVGLEEGLFPSSRSMLEISEIEEERRLCYVGITRAREKLYLTHAKQRMIYGSTSYSLKSRFIDEVPEELTESNSTKEERVYTKVAEAFKNFETKNTTSFGIDVNTFLNNITPNSSNSNVDLSKYQVGQKVEHKKFGVGTIRKIEEEGNDKKIEIDFEKAGMKRLMGKYAGLKILE